jgi:hypothetical protein
LVCGEADLGRSVWWNKTAHLMVARKKKKSREGQDKIEHPKTHPPGPTPFN